VLHEIGIFLTLAFFIRSCYTAYVKTLPGTTRDQSDPFASTHWSVILAAGRNQASPEVAQAALAELCETYWAPLYSFVRSRGHAIDDAQDLTQSFFAYLIEHRIYARADRQKGKFRSFLLASLKNFLGHAYDRERTLKRGGGQRFLPFDDARAEAAESLFQTRASFTDALGEDLVFERSWADALVAAGLERLSAVYRGEGKEKLFEELKIYLTGSSDPLPAYEELAARLGLVASTLRSHVTRLRARYRDALRTEVRRTVENDAQVDDELHELLRVLTRN
jgi:DNA-directed RNA polymerase specialized sigma24 family protein